jgi:peptidoglycan/LPS O-acetylase OafA/YrhL
MRRDIPALTSIRFFAALYVVLHHTAPLAVRSNPALNHFLLNGDSSVEMFFFLSGFILTYTNDKPETIEA